MPARATPTPSSEPGNTRRWIAPAAALLLLGGGLLGWTLLPREDWTPIQSLIKLEQWEQAEPHLKRWVSTHPNDGKAWDALAHALIEADRTSEAIDVLRRVPRASSSWSHSQTMLAGLLLKQNELAEADRVLREVVQHDPNAIEALERLTVLHVMLRRPAEAYDTLRRLYELTRDPRPLADSLLIAHLESELRDLSPELESHLQKTPDNPWLRRVWGLYLHAHNRPSEALPHLEAAAQSFRNDPVGRFALIECRSTLGIADNPLQTLGDEPAVSADAARWWVLRARIEHAAGQLENARRSLERALVSNPRDPEAHYRLGQLLIQNGESQAAFQHLDQAERLGIQHDELRRLLRQVVRGNADSDTFVRVARLCLNMGLNAEARDWLEVAIRADPRKDPLRFELADLPRTSEPWPFALSRPIPRTPSATNAPAATRAAAQPAPSFRFEDVTQHSGIHYQYECGETRNLFIGDTMGGGVALIDYDNDGWLDIYFINGCKLPFDRNNPPQPNKLYRNRGDFTFEDVTEHAGVPGSGYGMGCAVADYDADGCDDLFVTGLDRTILYRNRGDGTFEDVTARAGVACNRWTTAAGFADLDGDGHLDLMLVTYVDAKPEDPIECKDRSGRPIHCQPERFEAQLDVLFRNNGDGSFSNVSSSSGIEVPNGRGLGLAIADFDEDGLLDLFVANDGTANFLFRNLGNMRFEEVALRSGAAYDGSGQPTASMGVVAEDLNGDGRIDLLHTNFINQGCTLRWNQGGLFIDGTMASNLALATRAKTGWGVSGADFDNDGYPDLFMANGHVDDQPWLNTPMAQLPQLFRGNRDGRFDPVDAAAHPYFTQPVAGRGAAAGDLDNDGRVDLVIVHRNSPAVLLRNVSESGHWLAIRLRGASSGKTPVGATLTCRAGNRTAVRRLTSGTGYLSSGDPRIWFGLGSAESIDRLEVRWPSGLVQTWHDIPTNQNLEVHEGQNQSLRPMVPP